MTSDECRRRAEEAKMRVGEVADGDGDVPGKTLILPIDGRAACRTKMKGHDVAAFSRPSPSRGLTAKGDLLKLKARLIADHSSSTALALQAVAHSDARWFALNREVKLSTATGGASSHW
jgi:hypothetical protein